MMLLMVPLSSLMVLGLPESVHFNTCHTHTISASLIMPGLIESVHKPRLTVSVHLMMLTLSESVHLQSCIYL